jgi:2,3-bisphosphoglycerate-dependent phosphoglycerate mutase
MTNTTILLVRHGQTDWNLTRRNQGHIDIPLNDAGRRQSELVAQRLASWPVSGLYSSDLLRSSQTAAIIGRRLGIEPVLQSALRERRGGIFEGYTFDELRQRHPEALQAFQEHGRAPEGAESNLALARRATPALERIVAAHPGEVVALVTHGGTLRVLMAYIMGLPVGRKAPFKVSGNCGLSIAEFAQRRFITLLNDCCHLGGFEQGAEAFTAVKSGKDGDEGYAIG